MLLQSTRHQHSPLRKQMEKQRFPHKDVGISVRQHGIGDGVQFSSLPENFFAKYGHKIIDVSQPWYFDHNPYVTRDLPPAETVELWNFPRQYDYPFVRESVYMNNAERHAILFGIKEPTLIRPRLYLFEDFPFHERKNILFHPHGKSHGSLPPEVIDHIVKKYNCDNFYQIGDESDSSIPDVKRIETKTIWDLVKLISQCRMLLGVDSGPSWIAACYPDVIIKKIRTKFQYGYCEPKDWVAMDVKNEHSHWDDQTLFKIYNCFEHAAGFTESYKHI